MYTIGLDLHKLQSQLCIGHPGGTIEERRIATMRDRFTTVLAEYRPARILLEASTESEWVARHLEQLGHEVIVADPNFAPMYATRSAVSKPTAVMRAPSWMPAAWGRIERRIAAVTNAGTCTWSSPCETRWCARALATSA